MIENLMNLNKNIKTKEFKNFYILFGNDIFILKNYVEKIVNSAVNKKFINLNFTEIDGENFSFDIFQNALDTVAFMSNYRVVVLKNLCYNKLSCSNFKKMIEIVKNIATTSILLIIFLTENFDYGELKKFKNVVNKFEKNASIVECNFKNNLEIFQFFSNLTSKLGSKINKINFEFLAHRLMNRWQLVYVELQKLCSYAHNREICRDDILMLVKPNLNFSAFELVFAILNSNLQKALTILNELNESNVNVFLICGAIFGCFIDLYRVKLGLENGFKIEQIIDFFNYRGCEFKIRNVMQFCNKFNLCKIKRCIFILTELDLKLKTTSINKLILVEKTIIKMVCL